MRLPIPASFALFLTVLSTTHESRAADPLGVSPAQRLFDEARVFAEKGRWTEACIRLAESLRLERNMTTEFRLADCYEHTGKIASAWTHYTAAAEAAGAAGESAKQRFAIERATLIEPKLDRLVIAPPTSEDITVERDGRVVLPTSFNTPEVIDPGEHTVLAFAPNKISFATIVSVSGKGTVVKLSIPALEEAPPASKKPSMSSPEPARASTPMSAGAEKADASQQRKSKFSSLTPWGIGIGLGGIAAVGVGAGLVAGTDTCANGECVAPTMLLASGTVAVVFGTVLVLLGASSP